MLRLMGACVILTFIGLTLSRTTRSDSSPDKDVDKTKQIAVEVHNSTTITLRWAQPRVTDRACPIQRYMIRLRQDGQKQAKTTRFDGTRLFVVLHDLRPATVYHVRLLSIACDNRKKSSRWIRIATTEQTTNIGHQRHPPVQPTSVRTITLTDSVIVTWLPPEDDVFVRSYIIGYGEGVPDVNWRYVNGSQRNVTLKNLKPLTQYVISVRAFNDAGKGPVVYDIVYTKEASAVASGSLPAPTHLRSRMISSSTALLQWTDPSLEASQRITDERYYNVYYQSLPNGKNLSVIVKALQVTLYDLLPNKNYRFTVRTVKGSATSPFSDSVSSRTPGHSGTITIDGKGPKVTPIDTRNKTVATSDDDYDYEVEETTGYDAYVVQPGAGTDNRQTDFKTKRANTIVHESLARTLTSTNASSSSSTQNDVKVSFRFMVQYRISAYVTWPERLSPCSPSDETKMAGYLFRYKTIDDAGEYVTRNLATNFILLENLVPNTRYKYQVKYVMDRGGNTSAWSQEASLDTSYSPGL